MFQGFFSFQHYKEYFQMYLVHLPSASPLATQGITLRTIFILSELFLLSTIISFEMKVQ